MTLDLPPATLPNSGSVTDRVLNVLDLFMGSQPEWTVEDAAAAMGIPASTIYRYFRSLAAHGLIYDHLPGRYVLGSAVMLLDRQMRVHDPLIQIAVPIMQRLAQAISQPCVLLLARLYQDAVMCIHQLDHGSPGFAVSYERGRMMPLDRGATSKVIFANLPGHVARRTAHAGRQLPLRDAAKRRELRRIKADGFCVAQGEVDPGRIGIAVPIVPPHGQQVASLSVVIETPGEPIESMIAHLRHARQSIEAGVTEVSA